MHVVDTDAGSVVWGPSCCCCLTHAHALDGFSPTEGEKCTSIYATAELIATYDMNGISPNLFYCTHRYCTRNLHIFICILMN